MTYVVTFGNWTGEHECFTVDASCVEIAIMDAQEKANEKHNHSGYNFYGDSNVVSVIRV